MHATKQTQAGSHKLQIYLYLSDYPSSEGRSWTIEAYTPSFFSSYLVMNAESSAEFSMRDVMDESDENFLLELDENVSELSIKVTVDGVILHVES